MFSICTYSCSLTVYCLLFSGPTRQALPKGTLPFPAPAGPSTSFGPPLQTVTPTPTKGTSTPVPSLGTIILVLPSRTPTHVPPSPTPTPTLETNRGKKRKNRDERDKYPRKKRKGHKELNAEMVKLVHDASAVLLKVGQGIEDMCHVVSEQATRLTDKMIMLCQAISNAVNMSVRKQN